MKKIMEPDNDTDMDDGGEVVLTAELQALKDDILTMDEARAIMRIGRNSMLNALQDGTIPAAKVGRQWRISKRVLLAFLAGQKEF
ncbi:MAG: helix-turn-helix domain-containing protein [Clostridia bacterium]|nr:helix-turn-helix domain-containing protein [Clostridia bacterium]